MRSSCGASPREAHLLRGKSTSLTWWRRGQHAGPPTSECSALPRHCNADCNEGQRSAGEVGDETHVTCFVRVCLWCRERVRLLDDVVQCVALRSDNCCDET